MASKTPISLESHLAGLRTAIAKRLEELPKLLAAQNAAQERLDADPTDFELLTQAASAYEDVTITLGLIVRYQMELRINQLLRHIYHHPMSKDPKLQAELPRILNQFCHRAGTYFAHPDNDGPCFLVGYADKYGMKFMLQDVGSKKRSHTTRDLRTLLPLRLYDVPTYLWPAAPAR